VRAACQSAHPMQRRYDELLAPTTAGACTARWAISRSEGLWPTMATGVEGGTWG
jgi:hypothetical protein